MRSHKLVYGLAAMTLVGTLGLAACGSSETTTTATAGADGATAATDTEGDGEAAFTEYPIGEDQEISSGGTPQINVALVYNLTDRKSVV